MTRTPDARGARLRRLAAAGLLVLAGCRALARDEVVECEILIVGGSFGGCAAAIGSAGRDVWIVEDSAWIGGQVTAQGVSALDEHAHVESFGVTRAYREFRAGVRARAGAKNPGGGWVSRLCFEPRVGLAEIEAAVARSGARVMREARVERVETAQDRIVRVDVRRKDGGLVVFHPVLVLDATDTGDLYPLAGIEHRVGAEAQSETREPHALAVADKSCIQSYTYPFAVEFRPGESHVEPAPADYERFRDEQPYSLAIASAHGAPVRFGFLEKLPGSPGAFFTYRQIGPALALVNWPGNDYRGASVLEHDHAEARRLSLGFLHWLQTECPRDDGGRGYPELRLRRDVMGTDDGLSMRPYVREGRRLVARTTIVENDVTVGLGVRGRMHHDSVGLGWYPIDVHACAGQSADTGGLSLATKPFDIPLGALLPIRVRNVIAAGKGIGTTHVTNGCYRVHPVEWSIGEAAGELARFALENGVEPARVRSDTGMLRELQARLLAHGAPIFWYVDLVDDQAPIFAAAQALAVWGILPAEPGTREFKPTKERVAEALALFDKACAAR